MIGLTCALAALSLLFALSLPTIAQELLTEAEVVTLDTKPSARRPQDQQIVLTNSVEIIRGGRS